MLPEVEKRRSGAVDVARIASTRRARRESHGKIFTLGVLREESKQLVKAVIDATIRFLAKRWKYLSIEVQLSFPHQEGDQVSPFLGRYQP